MTKQYDFKGSLKGLINNGDITSAEQANMILLALRIADRLQSGEVSEECFKKFEEDLVIDSGWIPSTGEYGSVIDQETFPSAVKAMAQQLIKELNNGLQN